MRQGEKQTIRAPNPDTGVATALRAAIEEVRSTEDGDDSVAFELSSPVGAGLRGVARVVLGMGAVVVTTLLMALVVVDADIRSVVLAILVGVAVVGGLFVMVVWRADVGITVHDNGRLRRRGWNGITEVDLRRFQRVTVTLSRRAGGPDDRPASARPPGSR